jgi:UDP-glucose 4-epimerase
MRYLITGAAGFVGSHLSLALATMGHKVIGLDLGFSAETRIELSPFPEVKLVIGSVLDEKLLGKLIHKSDYVIHLAAIASPEFYVREPKRTIDLNLNASIAIIEQLRFTGKGLFYSSTSEIYGKNPQVPWSELDDRVLGSTSINRWCYSTSKAMVEHYMYACHQEGSLDFSGVRIFNCYGPRLKGRVVDSFIESAILGKKLIIHGDGKQTRCFTYIDDLIKAITHLVTSAEPSNKFYNIGSNAETSINELARITCEITGLDPESHVTYVTHSQAIGDSYEDISRRIPNYSLAEQELGWKPAISLREGIGKMYTYLINKDSNEASAFSFAEVDE